MRDSRKEILERYAKIIEDVFGIKAKISKVRGKECYELKVSCKYASDVMRYLVKNYRELFFASEDVIKSFLRGLFDAEGTVSNVVSLYLENEGLLNFVKLLLLRLGSSCARLRNQPCPSAFRNKLIYIFRILF